MQIRGSTAAIIIVSFVVLLVIGSLTNDKRSGDKGSEPTPDLSDTPSGDKARKPAPVVFDIPPLVGKSIDGVREILGKPEDKQPEPTELQLRVGVDEWNNGFCRGGEELLVTFNPRTRQVVDFFLPGEHKPILMQQGNLTEGAAAYRIEPVRQIRNRSRITGIKIIPRARRP